MPYVGNKKDKSEPILDVINSSCFDGMKYVEPFVGMGHILRRVVNKSSYEAGDLRDSTYVIMCALQRCQTYPNITRPVYQLLHDMFHDGFFVVPRKEEQLILSYLHRIGDRNNFGFTLEEMTAFASQATPQSRPWDGYQGNKSERNSKNKKFGQNWKTQREVDYNLLLDSDTFQETNFFHRSFQDWSSKIKNSVIYCDAPYQSSNADNSRHYGTPPFNFDAYWNRVRKWSEPKLGNFVIVSEYNAPPDFVSLLSFKKKGVYDKYNTEKLFMTRKAHTFWRNKMCVVDLSEEMAQMMI